MHTTATFSSGLAAVVIGIASILATSGAHADIYKWVDEQGQIHYGDAPKGQAERIQRTSPDPAPENESVPEQSSNGLPPATSQETPFAMGKAEASSEERCREFRARVNRYKNAGDMFIDQPDGTRHKLADEERERLISRTQSQADKACSE